MALKLTIKPGERIYLAGGTIEFGGAVPISIDGRIPVLRETEYLKEDMRTTPGRRLVGILQEAYISGITEDHRDELAQISLRLHAAGAVEEGELPEISNLVAAGETYAALKVGRRLLMRIEGVSEWASVIGFRALSR